MMCSSSHTTLPAAVNTRQLDTLELHLYCHIEAQLSGHSEDPQNPETC